MRRERGREGGYVEWVSLVVDVYDTFNTVCTLLDIKIGRKTNGKFVEDILAERELLK